jgi:hypothetical protein
MTRSGHERKFAEPKKGTERPLRVARCPFLEWLGFPHLVLEEAEITLR